MVKTEQSEKSLTADNADNKIMPSEHKTKYNNVIITLLSLLVLPVYLYGIRVFLLLGVSLLTAIILDTLFVFFRNLRAKGDYSSIVTALIVVMLMPATVPVFVIVVSVCIGVCVAKYPFGGVSHNIFNPAAVGVAFTTLCWPEYILKYPTPYTTYTLTDGIIQYGSSPSSVLRVGGTPKIDYFDILLGKFCGPLGTTCVIVLAACALYLILRKVISKRIVLSALAVVATFAIFFPRVLTGRTDSLVYEFSSGALLFAIIFMAGDPTTTPDTKGGRIFYGILLGISLMMFRYFGKVELSEVYAILFANVFAHSCDRYANFLKARFFKKREKREKRHNKETVTVPTDIAEEGVQDA